MNIWIINHYAIPPSRSGGTRHHSLARELCKRGHKVSIIASNSHYTKIEDLLSPNEDFRQEIIEEIQYLWVKSPSYADNALGRFKNMFSFGVSILRASWQNQITKPDLIISSTPHLFTPFFSILLAKKLNTKIIIEVRDIWPDSIVEIGNISNFHPMILIFRAIEKYIYKNANGIITLLPASIPYIKKTSNLTPIICIPNGIDLKLIQPEKLSFKKSNGLFTVMYAGAHGAANGLNCVINAAAKLRDRNVGFQLRLIGQGHEKASLIQLAIDYDLQNISFEDPVPKSDIHAVMAEADAFIFILKKSPVFRWGISPNKLFDYMAVGRPILFGVDTPYNPILESQSGYFFDSDSSDDLANSIEKIINLPLPDQLKMGINAKEFVFKNHNFNILGEKLNEFVIQIHDKQ